MTNQEAIEILSAYYEMDDDRQNVALDMAISALQAQELANNSPKLDSGNGELTDGDLISRKAAISELMEWVEKEEKKSWSTFNGLFHWTGVKAMLECLPSAEPEPSIPISWIEKHVDWLKNMDNEFANLTAMNISTMVKKWKKEQEDNDGSD